MTRRRSRPIWAAYNDTNTLGVACPQCAAAIGMWCTKPDGRVSRVPCVARIAAADIPATPAGGHQFGEPRHPRREGTRQ